MIKYYLVGRVPVKIEKRSDGTTVIQAYNATLGCFETNSRYYSMIRRDDTGMVRKITQEVFDVEVAHLSRRAS